MRRSWTHVACRRARRVCASRREVGCGRSREEVVDDDGREWRGRRKTDCVGATPRPRTMAASERYRPQNGMSSSKSSVFLRLPAAPPPSLAPAVAGALLRGR